MLEGNRNTVAKETLGINTYLFCYRLQDTWKIYQHIQSSENNSGIILYSKANYVFFQLNMFQTDIILVYRLVEIISRYKYSFYLYVQFSIILTYNKM
jgi:hypothetical protein